MSRISRKLPSYRLHRASGQAIVTIGGIDHYLGCYGTGTSREKYDRLIAEWLANGRRRPTAKVSKPDLTIDEMILAYWKFAEGHYRRDGESTRELDNIRDALRPLRRLYGATAAKEFGPLALKAVQQSMIRDNLCRTTINYRVSKIKRCFRWAVECELIPVEIHQGVVAVTGLRRGRDGVREGRKIVSVDPADVEKTLPYLSPQLSAMVQLQLHTGMRPAEVCCLKPSFVDRDATPWRLCLERHKTDYTGDDRTIYLGPRSQQILEPWLKRDQNELCFRPCEAERQRSVERRQRRLTPMTPSQRRRHPLRGRSRAPGERYSVATYRRAIERACVKARVPRWHPNQLRHTAATRLRAQYGVEAAQTLLGHRSVTTTQVYAERNLKHAQQIALESG